MHRFWMIVCFLLLVPATAFAGDLDLDTVAGAGDKLAGTDGKSHSIADVRGKKGTLVIFTCNHCPYVKAWDERTAKLGNAALEKGIGVIAINSNDDAKYPEDGFDKMVERAKALGIAYPYVVDATSALARNFGATKTPEFFLFDADGALVYHGALDDEAEDESKVSKRWLADAIDALAAGKAIAVAETKAFGCGIKFRP